MIEFEKPNIECLEVDDTNNYAKFVCEPLERGYGVTIGNSLRRILLSSLPGCAITSVKIEGVLHEFSTIPNVVEDVPEIIVNLKNVRLKFDGNEEKILRIDFKSEGEVTAADIITDGTVEILNPELHIATVSKGWSLKMEMTADRGRGYNSSDKNKKPNQDISVLPIDSIYTHVKKLNYQVESIPKWLGVDSVIITKTTSKNYRPIVMTKNAYIVAMDDFDKFDWYNVLSNRNTSEVVALANGTLFQANSAVVFSEAAGA